MTGKPYAIMICIAGTFCGGAFMTFSSKLLSEKLDIIKLTFYTAPVSVMCLAPFVYMIEVRGHAASSSAGRRPGSRMRKRREWRSPPCVCALCHGVCCLLVGAAAQV